MILVVAGDSVQPAIAPAEFNPFDPHTALVTYLVFTKYPEQLSAVGEALEEDHELPLL